MLMDRLRDLGRRRPDGTGNMSSKSKRMELAVGLCRKWKKVTRAVLGA